MGDISIYDVDFDHSLTTQATKWTLHQRTRSYGRSSSHAQCSSGRMNEWADFYERLFNFHGLSF